ncbi:START domain-containing protein [Toxoplasma gondii MAS]|uniref:START domain-containing protein n=1 Tax=Toxoplasma gondii MAS TaxID=943118 RepID=A0A086QUG9_TOXGO|nr:START domain-containing protein [Toxoplasma gondii MAS]
MVLNRAFLSAQETDSGCLSDGPRPSGGSGPGCAPAVDRPRLSAPRKRLPCSAGSNQDFRDSTDEDRGALDANTGGSRVLGMTLYSPWEKTDRCYRGAAKRTCDSAAATGERRVVAESRSGLATFGAETNFGRSTTLPSIQRGPAEEDFIKLSAGEIARDQADPRCHAEHRQNALSPESLSSWSSRGSLDRVSLLRPAWLPTAAPPTASGAPEPPAFLREEAAALLRRAELRAETSACATHNLSVCGRAPSRQRSGALGGGDPPADPARPVASVVAGQETSFSHSIASSDSAEASSPVAAPRTKAKRHTDASPSSADFAVPREQLPHCAPPSVSAKATAMTEGGGSSLAPVAGPVAAASLATAYLCHYEPEFQKAPDRPVAAVCQSSTRFSAAGLPGPRGVSSELAGSALPPPCRPPPAVDVSTVTPFLHRNAGENGSSFVSVATDSVQGHGGNAGGARCSFLKDTEAGPLTQGAEATAQMSGLPVDTWGGRNFGARPGDGAALAEGVPELAGPAAPVPVSPLSAETLGDAALSPNSEGGGRTRRRRKPTWRRGGQARRSSREGEAGRLEGLEGAPERGVAVEGEVSSGVTLPSSRRPPRWIRFFARRLICMGPREGKEPPALSKRLSGAGAVNRATLEPPKDSKRLAGAHCPASSDASQALGAAFRAPLGLGEPVHALSGLQGASEKRHSTRAAADGAVVPVQPEDLTQCAWREAASLPAAAGLRKPTRPSGEDRREGEGGEEANLGATGLGVSPRGNASARPPEGTFSGDLGRTDGKLKGAVSRDSVGSDGATLASERCGGSRETSTSQWVSFTHTQRRRLSTDSFSSASSQRRSDVEVGRQGEGQGASRADVRGLLSRAEVHGKRESECDAVRQPRYEGTSWDSEKERRENATGPEPEAKEPQTFSPETCSTEASPATTQEEPQQALAGNREKAHGFACSIGREAGPLPEAAAPSPITAHWADPAENACKDILNASTITAVRERPGALDAQGTARRCEQFDCQETSSEELGEIRATGEMQVTERKPGRECQAKPSPADSIPGLRRLASTDDAAEFVLGVLEERRAAFNLRQSQASDPLGHCHRQKPPQEKARRVVRSHSGGASDAQCFKQQGPPRQGTCSWGEEGDGGQEAEKHSLREGSRPDWDRRRELLELAELLLDVAVVCLDDDAASRSATGQRGGKTAPLMPCVYDKNGLKVWKKEFGVGRVLIKASFMLPVLPEQYASFASDSRLRATWDANLGGHAILETVTANTDICQVLMKRVATLYPRDLVTLRAKRSWVLPTAKHEPAGHFQVDERQVAKQVYASCSCSIDHPAAPEHSSHVRMDIRLSAYIASPVVTPFGVWTQVTLFSEADPKGWIPAVVSKSLAAKVLPSTVEKMAVNMLNHYGIEWDGPSATGYAARRLENYCEEIPRGESNLKCGW